MVTRLPAMIDMSLDDAEKKEMSEPSLPKYPYGLCISLCQDELEKLGLDDEELCVGDMLHLHALAKVTSTSSYESEDGSHSRVELQICYMTGVEDEEKENKSVETILYRK